MKSVLIAIQPYWVFLIIAKIMGWKIDQEKTVEVRKNFPKDLDWNRKSIIYCSKNKQSFNRIPKKYQPLMERFLGRVIGDFVCDHVYGLINFLPYDSEDFHHDIFPCVLEQTCLEDYEIDEYLGQKDGYGWHISNLVIYDKPKELGEFKPLTCDYNADNECINKNKCKHQETTMCWGYITKRCNKQITRPPQSWCYVEDLGV